MRRRRGLARRLGVYGGAVAGLLILGVVFDVRGLIESRMVYFPSRAAFITPAGVEDVFFRTADGLTLHGWYVRPIGAEPGAPAPAVLHLHGNAGNVEDHAAFSAFLAEHGLGVLMFDYRSFGRSDMARGRLSRRELLVDAHAALDYLRSRPDVGAVGVYGFSLGGVLGLCLAAERPEVACVATVGAFASWRGIARRHAGWIGAALMKGGCDARDAAARLGDRPLLLVHGELDEIVPTEHAAALDRAAAGAGVPASTLLLARAGHNDAVVEDGRAQSRIAEFFLGALGKDR